MQLFEVEVRSADGAPPTISSHSLPITIGRGAQAVVRLATSDENISRIHAELVADGDGVKVVDHSTNGTEAGGRKLSSGQSAPLGKGGDLSIGGFRIKVTAVEGGAPVLFVMAHRGDGHSHNFPLGGTSLAVTEENKAVSLDLVRAMSGDEAAKVYGGQSGKGLIAFLSASTAGGKLTVVESDRFPTTLNRQKLKAGTHAFKSLDVVKIGTLRLEVLAPKDRAVVCVNAECELLNPYVPEQNCRWCGYKLVEGATRIVAR